MSLSAPQLILGLHGDALRSLSDAMGVHPQGLGAIARAALRGKRISGRTCKRLTRLDDAFAVVRHITASYASGFLAELSAELDQFEEENAKDLDARTTAEGDKGTADGMLATQKDDELYLKDLTERCDATENITDVPEAEKIRDKFYRARVKRKIDGVWFSGIVEDIEMVDTTKEKLYKILFDDGDRMHLTLPEVEEATRLRMKGRIG